MLKEQGAQGLIEYALVLVLVAIIVVALWTLLAQGTTWYHVECYDSGSLVYSGKVRSSSGYVGGLNRVTTADGENKILPIERCIFTELEGE